MSDQTQLEQQAYSNFSIVYETAHPKPTMREISGLGWQFWLAITWFSAAAIAVAIRTASEFHRIELLAKINETLAFVSAFLILIAIEGGMGVASAMRASKKREYSEQSLNIGIWLTLGISIIVGLTSSIANLPEAYSIIADYIRILETIAIGVGLSVVVYISGEIVGVMIAVALSDRDAAVRELRKEVEDWQDKLNSSWSVSDDRVIVIETTKIAANQARSRISSTRSVERSAPRSVEQNSDSERSVPLSERSAEQKPKSQSSLVREWLIENYDEYKWVSSEDIPTAREIVSSFAKNDVRVALSSAHSARVNFIAENFKELS